MIKTAEDLQQDNRHTIASNSPDAENIKYNNGLSLEENLRNKTIKEPQDPRTNTLAAYSFAPKDEA